MPYVERAANGAILALFAAEQPGSAEEFLPDDHSAVLGFLAPATPTVQPSLFAAAAIGITDGQISLIEQAAQLSSAVYEDGWAFVVFSEARQSADYLIFAQTDIPAKIEQFKEPGYFELVLSDPTTGDPINPGRIDIQILEVR